MKYTKEQRLDIGRRVYEGELSRYDAAEEYDLNYYTVREYERAYRESKDLPPKQIRRKNTVLISNSPTGLEDLESMTKEELIREIVRARIKEARLKKGYEVKGDGSVIIYDKKNTK